jgi:two-component system chemotaxis sensor kinase CheA
MASSEGLDAVAAALAAESVVIEAIPRRRRPTVGRVPPPSLVASAAPPPVDGGVSVPATRRDEDGQVPVVDHREASLRSVSQSVRVDIHKLDHLMNVVGELAIVRSALARIAERLRGEGQRQVSSELLRLHRSFDRRLMELQDGILEVRMVPLGQVFDRLARVVRQLSRDAAKEIRLVITGAETENDKLIVEEHSDPLLHMIRNASNTGSACAVRASVGKRARARSRGTPSIRQHVMIEIEDDGAASTRRRCWRAPSRWGPRPRPTPGPQRDELLARSRPGFHGRRRLRGQRTWRRHG